MATTYDGKERRNVDYIEALINSVKELVNVRFETLEKRLDQIEKDISSRLDAGESRIKDLEDAPAKKAEKLQKGFVETGRDLVTKAVWGAGLAFVGFVIVSYFQNGGSLK